MAIDWGIVLPNIIGSVLLLILVIIFIYHSMNQKRPVYYFLATLILAFLSTFLVAFAWIVFDPASWAMQFMRSIYLTISGLQLLVFFVFLENSQFVKVSTKGLVISIGLFMIQCFGLWALVGFFYEMTPYDAFHSTFSLISKLGFNLLAIYVYGFKGIKVYYHMYTYTKERKSLLVFISVLIITLGYVMSLITDIVDAFQDLTGFWGIMKTLADSIPILGVFMLVIIYVSDISFIYRLPFNHYFLMVSYRSGLPLFSIPFQTKGRTMHLQEGIFSGMMSALNTVYSSILFSEEPIEEIRSEGISLFAENGKFITATVASEQVSRVLYRGMRQFVSEFETIFEPQLINMENDMDQFMFGKLMFTRIFPFLIPKGEIQELKTNFNNE